MGWLWPRSVGPCPALEPGRRNRALGRERWSVVGMGVPGGAGGLAALAPGSRVAGYLLEEEVGAGGMAVVFRARDERLEGGGAEGAGAGAGRR